MATKDQNIFRQSAALAANPLWEVLEETHRAEIEVGTGLHQAQVAMEAEKVKAVFAQAKVREILGRAGAEYLLTLQNIEACRLQDGLGDEARALLNDYLDHLEELAGQHLIGLVTVADRNIAILIARRCVVEKKGWLKRLVEGEYVQQR